MTDIEKAAEATLKTLLERAAKANSALDAMQFAQAAQNAAGAFRIWDEKQAKEE